MPLRVVLMKYIAFLGKGLNTWLSLTFRCICDYEMTVTCGRRMVKTFHTNSNHPCVVLDSELESSDISRTLYIYSNKLITNMFSDSELKDREFLHWTNRAMLLSRTPVAYTSYTPSTFQLYPGNEVKSKLSYRTEYNDLIT